MSHRIVVNVATDSWVPLQQRLRATLVGMNERFIFWANQLPSGSPPHRSAGYCAGAEVNCVPYAFKAYALRAAQGGGYTSLLWCDACVVPVKPLDPIWDECERNGLWICRNGWNNYQWTADSAYADLFSFYDDLETAREQNVFIPHVVATAFAVSTAHPIGEGFLDEYFRLASTTKAFCGPWQNSNAPREKGRNTDRTSGPCGPPSVLGHRHDQTAASVIAWRLGVTLDNPRWFSYDLTDDTILWAKG